MDESTLVYLSRLPFAVVGVFLIARLLLTARAYISKWAFASFLIGSVAFPAIGVLRLNLFGFPDNLVVRQILETVFILGMMGSLFEHVRADQRRHRDTVRLAEQWRQATYLAERRARQHEMLAAVTARLVSSLDLGQVLQSVMEHVRQLSEADRVVVYLRDRETGELYHHGVGVTVDGGEPWAALPGPRPNGLTAAVARTGQPAFIAQAHHHPLYADCLYPALQAIASLPLRVEGEVVGVLNVTYSQPHEFDADEIRVLSALADASALAVNNAALHEQIAQLAVTDDLTGLANRRRFLAGLRAEVQRARRYGRPLSLLMIDLDNLKMINDSYGHAAGDAVLRGLAGCLVRGVRETDLPARLGGDEFAVLLPETEAEAALCLARRIRAGVAGLQVEVDGQTIRSTMSIGLVSRRGEDLPDLPAFLSLADEALYQAKAAGRNGVVSASSQNLSIDEPAETC